MAVLICRVLPSLCSRRLALSLLRYRHIHLSLLTAACRINMHENTGSLFTWHFDLVCCVLSCGRCALASMATRMARALGLLYTMIFVWSWAQMLMAAASFNTCKLAEWGKKQTRSNLQLDIQISGFSCFSVTPFLCPALCRTSHSGSTDATRVNTRKLWLQLWWHLTWLRITLLILLRLVVLPCHVYMPWGHYITLNGRAVCFQMTEFGHKKHLM